MMNELHLLSRLRKAMKSYRAIGILGLALTGSSWGQTLADSSRQQKPVPIPSESAEHPAAAVAKISTDDGYIIGNSDLLEINVWNEPGLTESIPVRSHGKISMPLIGEIQASGRTPIQLKVEITEKLRSFLNAPDVTVMAMQMNSQKFNILGRVLKPGSYPLLATTSVLDAIAQAGGFQDFAKQKGVYILRRTPGGGQMRIPFNYKDVIRGKRPDENIKLLPDDTIVVP
jgi:polysaccharide biosynthesis/export protein